MSEPMLPDLEQLILRQRQFFAGGKTKDLAFRKQQLQKLGAALSKHADLIMSALEQDLGKSKFEAYSSEILFCLQELKYTLKHLQNWAKPQPVSVGSPLLLFSRAYVQPEPLGVALIIAPWNYPVQLAILPLIGAIAAGNCAILKPSEIAGQTSGAIATLIADCFEPQYVAVVEGGIETSQALLTQQFDHIFFTGGTEVGRIVMAAAAKHLTPVTLELGGKSPCIVAADSAIAYTAEKIVWGKFFNAGQTCIAPDYVLVARSRKAELIAAMNRAITQFYSAQPQTSPDYGRIVSFKHFARLSGLIEACRTAPCEIIIGGETDALSRYIAPTLVDCQDLPTAANLKIMESEIFGPILPVVTYEELDQAIAYINQQPKPLALYLFSDDQPTHTQVLSQTSSGSSCINNLILQSGVPDLPFGGVGASGMGSYHGKYSFRCFSHYKSVLKSPSWLKLRWLYPPYRADLVAWIQRLISV
ncbi:MAG: aldehyde dehydrogenase [Pseudanabaenaceae cyanobacterium bins.68]|nr:aldehyde dehydrogenase [Pseudanabaenaceae cyanobacterium bins.68]